MSMVVGSWKSQAAPLSERGSSQRPRVGLLLVASMPLAAGLSTVEGLDLAGINYTGPFWLVQLLAAALVFLAERTLRRKTEVHFPWLLWGIWGGFLFASVAWSTASKGRALQDALQLGMPILVGVLASMFVRSERDLRLVVTAFPLALLLIVSAALLEKSHLAEAAGLGIAIRSMSLTAALIGCVALSQMPRRWIGPLAIWSVCLLVTVVIGSRMASLALLLAPIFHPLTRSRILNVCAAALVLVLAIGLFYTPLFQQRFFPTGTGNLSELMSGDFLSFGRFESWPAIWEEAWEHPWLGAGVGSTYEFVPMVWEDMHHVHNDYLRIGFEAGLIGLAIFLAIVLWQLADIRRHIGRTHGEQREAWTACWLALIVLLVTGLTDNTLVYNLWYTDPLFALLGAAYGLHASRQADLKREALA